MATTRTGKSRKSPLTPEGKERRGFAVMNKKLQAEIASKGGRAAHEKGTAHEWTSAEASEAGRKGGSASHGGRGKNWPKVNLRPTRYRKRSRK